MEVQLPNNIIIGPSAMLMAQKISGSYRIIMSNIFTVTKMPESFTLQFTSRPEIIRGQ